MGVRVSLWRVWRGHSRLPASKTQHECCHKKQKYPRKVHLQSTPALSLSRLPQSPQAGKVRMLTVAHPPANSCVKRTRRRCLRSGAFCLLFCPCPCPFPFPCLCPSPCPFPSPSPCPCPYCCLYFFPCPYPYLFPCRPALGHCPC